MGLILAVCCWLQPYFSKIIKLKQIHVFSSKSLSDPLIPAVECRKVCNIPVRNNSGKEKLPKAAPAFTLVAELALNCCGGNRAAHFPRGFTALENFSDQKIEFGEGNNKLSLELCTDAGMLRVTGGYTEIKVMSDDRPEPAPKSKGADEKCQHPCTIEC